jgi:hypothetical protein
MNLQHDEEVQLMHRLFIQPNAKQSSVLIPATKGINRNEHCNSNVDPYALPLG